MRTYTWGGGGDNRIMRTRTIIIGYYTRTNFITILQGQKQSSRKNVKRVMVRDGICGESAGERMAVAVSNSFYVVFYPIESGL